MNDADYFDACHDIGEDYLAHYGILGQKWGRRRYQNPDGTLTPLGRERLYGNSGKMKNISGVASLKSGDTSIPFRYNGSIPKNKLHRMMATADAERRLNRLDNKISRKKLKGKDVSKLEEKRRKVAVNKDLYSEGLNAMDKVIGKAELYKRDEKIGKIVGIPLATAATIGAMALRTYLPKIASTAISSMHLSPLMADIVRETNKSPVMNTSIHKIQYPEKTWEDIFGTEGAYDYLKTVKYH